MQDEGDTFDRSPEKEPTVVFSLRLSKDSTLANFEDQEDELKDKIKKQSECLRPVEVTLEPIEDGVSSTIEVTVEIRQNKNIGKLKQDARIACPSKTQFKITGQGLDPLNTCVQAKLQVHVLDQEWIKLERAMHEPTGKVQFGRQTILDDMYKRKQVSGQRLYFPGREGEWKVSEQNCFSPVAAKDACFSPSPFSVLSVSATTLPIFLRIAREGKTQVDIFVVKPGSEYLEFNTHKMEPLLQRSHAGIQGGLKEQYLTTNELRPRNGYGVGALGKRYIGTQKSSNSMRMLTRKEGKALFSSMLWIPGACDIYFLVISLFMFVCTHLQERGNTLWQQPNRIVICIVQPGRMNVNEST